MRAPVRWALGASVAVFLIAACGSDSGQGAGPAETTTSRPDVNERVAKRVVIDVSGAADFEYRETVELLIARVRAKDLSFYSVGIENLVPVGDGPAQFRAAFELGGVYEGPGKYELPVRQGGIPDPQEDPDAFARQLSQALVIYAPLGDPSQGEEARAAIRLFDDVREACTVEVDEGERSGRVVCPSIVDDAGDAVRWSMEWTDP